MSSILRTPNVPLARAWNTWDAGRPAEFSFRPLGVRVTPMAFAASAGKATVFPPGPSVRYGPHALDASFVSIDLEHAGTALTLSYSKPSDYDVTAHWTTRRLGEWGLRFWLVICLSADEGAEWFYDEARNVAHTTIGPRSVAVACRKPPLLVTGHASLADIASEYETHGYWHLASRAESGRVMGLRFNLDEMPENRFAVGIADRLDLAVERALELVSPHASSPSRGEGREGVTGGPEPAEASATPPPAPPPEEEGNKALAAIRDVIGWNTVWDPVNSRPYMTCSRNWDLKKFGGFGMWLNDMCVNALLASLFDADQGRENLSAVLYGTTPEGNLPCLLTGNDAWVDRTQSPIASLMVWMIYLRTRSRALIEAAYPVLARNNAWLLKARDGNRNGLLEFGSSASGRGLYQGTKLAAKDESFMDNSPIHDEATWMPGASTLDCEDVGLNSLAALDAEMLSLIAAELGHDEDALVHAETSRALNERIASRLWDGARSVFANRLWSGKFVRSLAPTSFYPMLCGAATPDQQAELLKHLADPQKFGGRFGLPSVARDDPAFPDNVYWRGRIWPLLNFLVWLGLRRCGHRDEADALAAKGAELFQASWTDKRLCPENYNADTGEGLDQPDTDDFYSWSALLPYMTVAQAMDFSPWSGWEFVNHGADAELGPIVTPLGRLTMSRAGGTTSLRLGARTLLQTSVPGRLTHVAMSEAHLSLRLPPRLSGTVWLRLPQVHPDRIELTRAGARRITAKGHAGGAEIPVTAGDAGNELMVVWTRGA